MSPEKDINTWMYIAGALVTLWSGSIAIIGRLLFGRLTALSKDVESLKKQAPSGDETCVSTSEFKVYMELMKNGIGEIKGGQSEIHSRIDDLINDVIKDRYGK